MLSTTEAEQFPKRTAFFRLAAVHRAAAAVNFDTSHLLCVT